jgi:hypothetical protein
MAPHWVVQLNVAAAQARSSMQALHWSALRR